VARFDEGQAILAGFAFDVVRIRHALDETALDQFSERAGIGAMVLVPEGGAEIIDRQPNPAVVEAAEPLQKDEQRRARALGKAQEGRASEHLARELNKVPAMIDALGANAVACFRH
jgi:hypothetical protein